MANDIAPAVSLLVPIYNVERYLRECLDSAKNQTLENIEIICINDGSTDSSPEIIREYMAADPRFKMIDKTNSGYGKSMNMGLDAATGKYIGILESDDFMEPDALESLYNAAEENGVPVARADFIEFWTEPEPREEKFGWVTPAMEGVTAPVECFEIFRAKPSIWAAIYDRQFLVDNEIRFTESPGASYQDTAFNFKVWCSVDKAVFLDKAVLHYRQDSAGSSVNSPGKVYCVCDEYAEIVRYLSERPEKQQILAPVVVCMRHDTYMWNYERLNLQLEEEFVRRMSVDFAAEDASGLTDYDMLEDWKHTHRRMIISDPLIWHAAYTKRAEPGKANTVKRYWKCGGFKGLRYMMKKRSEG